MAERRGGRGLLRPIAALTLAVLCWLAVWWRPVLPVPGMDLTVRAESLPLFKHARMGSFRITGAWHLKADKPGFDSLSALGVAPDGRLFAISDRSRWYRFPKPGAAGATDVGEVVIDFPGSSYPMADTESLVTNWQTGQWWTSIENFRAIVRYDPDGTNQYIQNAAMARWPANEGAEAMVRLKDGRFVMIAEWIDPAHDGTHPSLLFSGDPIESGKPQSFRFAMPGGTVPVEAALLPDGRVLVLGRKFGLPFGFSTNIAIADPAAIRVGSVWRGKEIGRLDGSSFADNYEGMAVEDGKGGKLTLWLVSDDNQAKLLQRTLLLKLETQIDAL